MHANVHADRNSWRLPPDETLQVADPKAKKAEVGDEEELALHDDEGHNWWSIIFSLLVIGLVIGGIVAAIFLVGYVDELLYWHGERMKLEELLQGELNPKRLPSSWISPDHFVFQADDGSLSILNVNSNFTVSILVTNHTLRQLNVKGYQCSKNLKYVLFQHNIKTVFRQSFTSHYTVYDVKKDHHIPVRLESSPKAQPERLQYVKWLADTTSLLIIFNNNIYLKSSPEDETDMQLTFTGQTDVIYNGIPDWLYQEDILQSPEALWSSYDGTHLLYATFNDSEVGIMNFPWFQLGTFLRTGKTLNKPMSFPSSKSVRYPTPGTPIPQVQLWVLDLANSTNEPFQVLPPKALIGQDYYLTSAGWIGQKNSQVAAVWINRAQNLSIVSACLAPNWTCIESHTERALERAWLEVQEHPIFSPDGDSFLMLAHVQEGSRETYTQIKHVAVTQQHIAVLSHGSREVSKILAWDTNNHLIWYLATEQHKAGQRHLYVTQDSSSNDDPRRVESHCITCDLEDVLWSSRYLYGNCSHFSAEISPQKETSTTTFYILHCQGPGLPLAGLHNSTSHKLMKILYDTRITHGPVLDELAMPRKKSFEVPLPHGSHAQVQLLLPPSWREELRDAAYPVVVEVNGRPGSKAVTEEFHVDWATFMSSHCDVVYVKLDVRGSRGQTNRALYHQLGGVEVQDQLSVIEYLLNKDHKYHKYLDKTRIGIWGWGYGGYVTSMVLGMGNQQKVFKCGIAVNPVTDWIYYNSAFTERILGFPTDNFKGYVAADATQRAKNIPKKSFFLLHGLADLTAPYQHSVLLSQALAQAGVIFRYQSYPDEGHNLNGVLEHLYISMQNFFEECLKLDTGEREVVEPEDT